MIPTLLLPAPCIRKKDVLGVCICVLSVLLLACSGSGKVNVLIITLDTTRADHLSCYDYSRPTSPTLEGLADGGVLFTEAFCTIPSTLPSHASILTGLYPLTLGVHDNNTLIPEEVDSLSEILSEKGYDTAAFVSSFVLSEQTNISQGFGLYDDQDGFAAGTLDRATNIIPGSRSAKETTRKALEWLKQKRKKGQPFFLWVHYYDPHFPYDPPSEYDRFGVAIGSHLPPIYDAIESGKVEIASVFSSAPSLLSPAEYQRAIDLYDGEIACMDAAIGDILEAVNASQEPTLKVVVADHGESFGEHGLSFCHNLLDEPCTRIPMILAFSGVIPEGKKVALPVSTVDLFPTVLSILKIRHESSNPVALQGVDLSELWAEEGNPGRKGVFAEDGNGLYMVRTNSNKGIISKDKKDAQLFDMIRDPSENVNMALTNQESLATVTKQIDEWFIQSRSMALGAPRSLSNQERLDALKSLGYARGGRDPK